MPLPSLKGYLLHTTALRRASFCAVAYPPYRARHVTTTSPSPYSHGDRPLVDVTTEEQDSIPFVHYIPVATQMPDLWR